MINRDTLRISGSLAGLAIFVIFIASWLGYIPDEQQLRAQSRAALSEALAIQFSITVQQKNINSIPITIKAVVERNPDIKAIKFSTNAGKVIGSYGNATTPKSENSTINYMVVPIFQDNKKWGRLEISFKALTDKAWWHFIDSTFYQLIVFVGIVLFLFYFLLIRKTFNYLDPNKVIPERVKKALNALTEGVVIVDTRGVIALTNVSFENKINSKINHLIGAKLSELSWSHTVSNENNLLPWDKSLSEEKSCNHITLKFKKSDDSVLTLITNCTPLYDSRKNLRGALVSFSDVTELEKMNQDLESMAQFLRHEMNNALIGASSTISLLETSENLDESNKKLLSRAHQSHRVIRYLLESASNANSIKESFSKEETYPLNLDKIISETVSKYDSTYGSNAFIYRSDGEPVIALGEEERIVQMLDKLATNAIDHGNNGTPVIFTCSKNKNSAIISVKNEGAALQADKKAMFDLFSSFSQNAAASQNQGIGLYVVKLIAETYGGNVHARDRKDVSGAEFIIELPLAE